jgi:hypothetical protein
MTFADGVWTLTRVTLAAHSSASAISSGVNAPCSASYWLTASRPARMMNSFRAVWAIQAL